MMLTAGNIVEVKASGFVMKVKAVMDFIVTCEFIAVPLERQFTKDELRFLADSDKPILDKDNDLSKLIADRNTELENLLTKAANKGRGKRTPSLEKKILETTDPDEILRLLKEAGKLN